MLWRRLAILPIAWVWAAWMAAPLAGTEQSWLVDAAKFHISAHGQLSCGTCHDRVASDAAHPDPQNVDAPAPSPDPAAGCFTCHPEVQSGQANGTHGRMREQHAGQFHNCVGCHNPHTVVSAAVRHTNHVMEEKPAREQCGACHAARPELPKPAADDARCMGCHHAGIASRERDAALCLHCHADGKSEAQAETGSVSTLIDAAAFAHTPHAGLSCAACHPGAAAYGHAHQAPGNCLACHKPHYAQARDPHANVECAACHASGGRMVRNPETGNVGRERIAGPGVAARTHAMVRHPQGQACARCHYDGNRLGASAAVLPAKSVLCVGCHAATLSVNDAVTIPSLGVFLLGLWVAVSFWLSGAGRLLGGLSSVSPARILAALKSLVMDTVLQRRLLRQSRGRWAIHSLIFLPFVIRSVWGMAVLVASWAGAHGVWYAAMVDRNHPVNAVLFDVTGLAVVAGVCAAIARGVAARRQRLPGLPGQDRAALGLIAGVVVVGFVLEGMRMAMTGAGAAAFVGYAISRAFTAGPALERAYGYVWYLHAALTGAFVAYLPFSRMFHILVAPVALAARAARHAGHTAHVAGD